MTKYFATICHDISHGVEVEADSVEEAVEKAWDEYQGVSPNLCHYCSEELDDGGPVRMIINTEAGVEVYDDGCEATQIVKLKEKVELLQEALIGIKAVAEQYAGEYPLQVLTIADAALAESGVQS